MGGDSDVEHTQRISVVSITRFVYLSNPCATYMTQGKHKNTPFILNTHAYQAQLSSLV